MNTTLRSPAKWLAVLLITSSASAAFAADDLLNLSLGKSTTQSSIDYSGISSRAVDGDTDGRWRSGTTTHTASESQPWWQVDLGSVNTISYVNLFNRSDSCCSDRLSNFYVLVSDTAFNSTDLDSTIDQSGVDSYYFGSTAASPTVLDINRSGRYVRVQLTGTNPLSLAEFEVLGTIGTVSGGTFNVPGKIEAEEFGNYSDSDNANRGGDYRTDEGVDIQATSDSGGGYNVGWTEAGEWLEYPISVSSAGDYTAQIRVASATSSGEFSIAIDGDIAAKQTVTSTGGWQNWQTHDVNLGNIDAGSHTLRVNVAAGFNLNWVNVVEGDPVVAVDPGCIRVNTLAKLKPYMNDNNVCVVLEPGTYTISGEDIDNGTWGSTPHPVIDYAKSLLFFEGSNNTFHFEGATIVFTADVMTVLGSRIDVWKFHNVGNNNTFKGLTITTSASVYDAPAKGGTTVTIDGKNNVVEGFHVTVKGSYPYGYGDAFGKGSGSSIRPRKQCGILIRGNDNMLKDSTVLQKSFCHAVFMQAADTPTIDNIYVEGEMRSTDDMLAEEGTGTIADEIDFQTIWGERLAPGYMMSLAEEGIRSYNRGETIIDGEFIERGTNDITVLNSEVKNTRGGLSIVLSAGNRHVENVTLRGNQNGFSIRGGTMINCAADAQYGPVYLSTYDRDGGLNADIRVLAPEGPYYNGSGAVAFLGLNDSKVTLRGEETVAKAGLVVRMGGSNNIASQRAGSINEDIHFAENVEIENFTAYPIEIINGTGITGKSCGSVTNNRSGNNVDVSSSYCP